jgi:tetratricopeptide (TPR) repeat protein
MALTNRGNIRLKTKDYDKALSDYNQAIRLDPTARLAYNNRAWLLATCPVAKYRDGKRAVESATRACELTGWTNAYDLGTLAAAYAESHNFPKAIHWQQKANALYNDPDTRKKGRELLALYQNKTPYREEP